MDAAAEIGNLHTGRHEKILKTIECRIEDLVNHVRVNECTEIWILPCVLQIGVNGNLLRDGECASVAGVSGES